MNHTDLTNKSNFEFIQQLINSIPEIICREHSNQQYIYLYKTRNYWSAFDKSAFLLSRLFKNTHTAILKIRIHPFPIIMVSISDNELQRYNKQHILCRDYPNHKVILVNRIIAKQYWDWRRIETESC